MAGSAPPMVVGDAPSAGPTTFHVVPCTLDGLRVPRGRAVGADKEEFCKGFVRKKFVAIPRDSDGCLQGTLPGGFKAKEVLELDERDRVSVERSITTCLRCSRKDTEHKSLRWTLSDLSGGERYRCKNCSYCESFCRVDLPDNSLCEDCGCEASLHQTSLDEPIPPPPKTPKASRAAPSEDAGAASGAGAAGAGGASHPNAAYKPGERYKVVGTIMRAGESLESEKITRLAAGTAIEVLELGAGPTGKRVRVRLEDGQEGWISVVSDAGVTLLKPLAPARAPKRQPRAPPASAASAARADEAATERPEGMASTGNIGSILGGWAGEFEAVPEEDEEPGVSISELLGGKLGVDFEVLAEEAAAKAPPAPVPERAPPPWDEEEEEASRPGGEPEEEEEVGVESLDELLRRLSQEEATDSPDAPMEVDATAKRQREEEEQEQARKRREQEEQPEDVAQRRRQHMDRMRERMAEARARKEARREEEGEEERRRRDEELELERQRRAQQEEEEEEEARRKQEEEDAALRRLEEEAAAARRAEEEEEAALRRAEEEAAALKQAEEDLKRAEEEAALKRAEEEAAWRLAQEEAERKRSEEEAEELRRIQEEELAAMQQAVPEETPLACATRRKDLFRVQALLRDKADANETNLVGETPLLEAAACGDVNVVALLLGHAADPAKRAPPGATDLDLGLSPEVRLLFKIFEERKVDTEAKRGLLFSLDPGAHAQARIKLRLGQRHLAYLENRLAPAAALASSGTVREFDATEDHQVSLHMADPVRPVLVLSPLWQPATATVIMLHGLFQSGRMFERIARDLSRGLPHARFLAPTGPTQGCHFGIGPAWCGPEPAQAWTQLQEVSAEVAELLRQGPPAACRPERVVLLGFSQGGTLATLVALQGPERFAGLMVFGTTGIDLGENVLPAAAGLEVLHCHGGSDGMVSSEDARTTAERLRRSGCRVHFSLHHDVGHTISPEMVTEARAWLASRLAEGTGLKRESTPEAAAHFFDIGADEDDEASNSGGDDGNDLDEIFGFQSAPKAEKEEPVDVGLDEGEEGCGGDNLDDMYDFTAFNNAALASKDDMYDFTAFNNAALASEEPRPGPVPEDVGEEAEDLRPSSSVVPEEDWELGEECAEGDGREVQVLLEHAESGLTASVAVDPTATMWSVKEAVAMKFRLGHTSVVRLLRKTGPYGTVLEGYSNDKPLGRRRRLLLLGVDLQAEADGASGAKSASPLAAAARRGDVEEVKLLLRQRADPNELDPAGETPLFSAARGGHADAVAVLLLGKADPTLRSENGLVAADLCPGPPVGALLWLALGAQVSAQDQRMAFEALEECARFLVARLLEQRGVRAAVRDVLSETEWVAACA